MSKLPFIMGTDAVELSAELYSSLRSGVRYLTPDGCSLAVMLEKRSLEEVSGV